MPIRGPLRTTAAHQAHNNKRIFDQRFLIDIYDKVLSY